jgi:pSer/pThr/pTyr-binding forkhead associated (FHA) protein
MNSRLKILLEAMAGAAGGFVAWAIMEPIEFLTSDTQRLVADAAAWWSLAIFGAIMGSAISAAIGAVEGLATGSRRQFWRSVVIGAVVGLGGGLIGLYFGQVVYARLQPQPAGGALTVSLFGFLQGVVARAVGWALVGLAIGVAQGVPSWSPRKMKHGMIGGGIGGFFGGMMFDFIGEIFQMGGELSRFVGMTITGAAIGFFLGLVQDLMKQAWVVVLRGRNEGREYILDKAVSILGRDELAEVGVFGDPSVAPRHAAIKLDGGAYVIEDLGTSPGGTLVNGQRVSKQGLREGDTIQLGATQILFHEKVGSAPARRARDLSAPPSPRVPAVADNICAFCGQAKDPRTGDCACTPVAPPAPGFAPAMEAAGATPGTGAVMPRLSEMPATAAQARLVGISGPYAGQTIPLSGEVLTIGREAGRDLVLSGDGTVSRRHALLRVEGGGYLIADEGSSNGTFVNDVRISAQPLRSGDRIRIGASEFVFEAGGAF